MSPEIKSWTDDAALLGAWRAGDEHARELLFRRYDRIARQRLAYKVRRVEDLDELVQQVLIRFTQALAHYDGRGKIRSFYATVEGRAVLDYYRRCYREPAIFDPEQLTIEDLDGLSPLCGLSLNRHLSQLARALETELTLQEKLVIEQLFIDRLSVAEVAKGLGLAESSVRGILMRARGKLKAHFGDDYMEIARGDELEFDELALRLTELGHTLGL